MLEVQIGRETGNGKTQHSRTHVTFGVRMNARGFICGAQRAGPFRIRGTDVGTILVALVVALGFAFWYYLVRHPA
jgi:hypothetical protein